MIAKQKILIVDDDVNIAELISLYLTKECFDTMIVNDGEAAIKQFQEYQPNLVLLDLMLPGIDGYEVCRKIRKTSGAPIIMLSAKGEIFDKVLGLELGADDYVIKPFEMDVFVKRIRQMFNSMKYSNEFKNNIINVHNFNVCNGCFNKHEFDRGDWNWCPEHKNTEKVFRSKANESQSSDNLELLEELEKQIYDENYDTIMMVREIDREINNLTEKNNELEKQIEVFLEGKTECSTQ